jgi:hypothetical protein
MMMTMCPSGTPARVRGAASTTYCAVRTTITVPHNRNLPKSLVDDFGAFARFGVVEVVFCVKRSMTTVHRLSIGGSGSVEWLGHPAELLRGNELELEAKRGAHVGETAVGFLVNRETWLLTEVGQELVEMLDREREVAAAGIRVTRRIGVTVGRIPFQKLDEARIELHECEPADRPRVNAELTRHAIALPVERLAAPLGRLETEFVDEETHGRLEVRYDEPGVIDRDDSRRGTRALFGVQRHCLPLLSESLRRTTAPSGMIPAVGIGDGSALSCHTWRHVIGSRRNRTRQFRH